MTLVAKNGAFTEHMRQPSLLECRGLAGRTIRILQTLECWRPVRDSNSCYRREREATYGNSKELSGMDSTLPHLKDSRERLLDV